MRDRRIIVSLSLAIIFFTISACAKKEIVRTVPLLPVPEKVTAETLLNKIDILNISTLKANIKLEVQHKNQSKGIFSGILLYSHPDRMSMRIFGPFGITIMQTLFNRGTLQVVITPKDTLYAGSVPFDRLLPDRDALANSVKFFEETDDIYVLYLMGVQQGRNDLILKAKYFFDKKNLLLNGLEIYAEGKKQVRIEIYKTEDSIPSDLGIYVRDAFFHLELKDIVLNKTLKDEYFYSLEASHSLPLSRFLRSLEPSQ